MSERFSAPSIFSEAWELVWERKLQFLSHADFELKRYQKHLEPIIGHLHLGDITPLATQDIVSHLIKKSYRPQTIKHIIGLIGRTFNQLIKWGLCNLPNPTTGASLPKADNRRQRYLTDDEAKRLLAALKERSEPTWALALLSLSTGMRLGEMLRLKGEHFNPAEKSLRVVDPKNKLNRTVFLPDNALEMLKNLSPHPGRFIFQNPSGLPFKTVSDTYHRVVKKLGLNDGLTDPRDKVVFHTLRHTFASWLTQDGTSVFLVAELLGHSSLEMTRRYSHMSPEKKRTAITAINGHLGNYTQDMGVVQDKYVQPCGGMYNHVQSDTDRYNHVEPCTDMNKREHNTQLHTVIHEFIQKTYVQLCNLVDSAKNTQLYTTAHSCT